MKILSWNLNHLDGDLDNDINTARKNLIIEQDADLVFVTNTKLKFNIGSSYKRLTTMEMPLRHDGIDYKEGENRVSIYTKYPCKNPIKTYDDYNSVCQMVETPLGNLNLYGTIIGAHNELFASDLLEQKEDLVRIEGAICYTGDLNASFTEPLVPSEKLVSELKNTLEKQKIAILTEHFENITNHITISKSFLKGNTTRATLIPVDTKLSNQGMIIVEIKEKEIKKQINNPLHGVKLAYMLEKLVDHYGWDELGDRIRINSFNTNPGIKSSLKFLRRTDWARTKVENLYLETFVD